MTYKLLDIVALTHSIETYDLLEGDTGTIVEVYGNNEAYEVEFVKEDGKTKALLTLSPSDIISPKALIFKWSTTLLGSDDIDVVSSPEESTTEVFHYYFA